METRKIWIKKNCEGLDEDRSSPPPTDMPDQLHAGQLPERETRPIWASPTWQRGERKPHVVGSGPDTLTTNPRPASPIGIGTSSSEQGGAPSAACPLGPTPERRAPRHLALKTTRAPGQALGKDSRLPHTRQSSPEASCIPMTGGHARPNAPPQPGVQLHTPRVLPGPGPARHPFRAPCASPATGPPSQPPGPPLTLGTPSAHSIGVTTEPARGSQCVSRRENHPSWTGQAGLHIRGQMVRTFQEPRLFSDLFCQQEPMAAAAAFPQLCACRVRAVCMLCACRVHAVCVLCVCRVCGQEGGGTTAAWRCSG